MIVKKLFGIVLFLAALFGVALRSVELLRGNFVFTFDQGLDLLAARSIIVDHKLTLIGSEAGAGYAGLPGLFHGPGYHYLLAIVMGIWRGDPYGAMFFLWVFQMLSVWFMYALTRRVFGNASAILSVFVALISPAFIGMSRVIWAPNFAGFFVAVFLFILFGMKRSGRFDFAVLGFAAVSLYHFEIPYAVVSGIGAVLYMWFVTKRRAMVQWGAFFAGGIVGAVLMIAFEVRHGFTMTRGLVAFLTNPVTVTKSAPFDVSGNLRTILYVVNSIFPPINNLPIWFWTVCIVAGLFWAVRTEQSSRIKQILYGMCIITSVHLIIFVPYRNPIYGHYLVVLLYVLVPLIGYLAYRLMKTHARALVYALFTGLSIAALSLYPRVFVYDFHDYGGTVKIQGKIDAIDAIYDMANGNDFNLLVFSPPVYTYPYDYMLLWYASKKYGYVPGKEKSGVVYLLMEPDPDKPWSYKGWLETVIIDGEVVDTVTLPSGFIIQKRIFTS